MADNEISRKQLGIALVVIAAVIVVGLGMYYQQAGGEPPAQGPTEGGAEEGGGVQEGEEGAAPEENPIPGTSDLSSADRVQTMDIDKNPLLDFYPKDKIIYQNFGIKFTNKMDSPYTIHFEDYDTTIQLDPGESKGHVFPEVDRYIIYFEKSDGSKVWGSISVKRS